MTTGPEHYVLAEQLLDKPRADALSIARAQVHATLALAAATAMAAKPNDGIDGMDQIDFEAWDAVAGVQEDEHGYEMTNADVMSAEEIDADGRDAMYALDAADEARWAAESEDGAS